MKRWWKEWWSMRWRWKTIGFYCTPTRLTASWPCVVRDSVKIGTGGVKCGIRNVEIQRRINLSRMRSRNFRSRIFEVFGVRCSDSEFFRRRMFGVFGVRCSDFSELDVRIRNFSESDVRIGLRISASNVRIFGISTSPTGLNLGLGASEWISNSHTGRSLGLAANGRVSTAQPAEA